MVHYEYFRGGHEILTRFQNASVSLTPYRYRYIFEISDRIISDIFILFGFAAARKGEIFHRRVFAIDLPGLLKKK